MTPVMVHRNLEADFEAWVCPHAEPQTPHEVGEVTLCALCTDKVSGGSAVVDEQTGKPIPVQRQ
jgi:hypothetical protein